MQTKRMHNNIKMTYSVLVVLCSSTIFSLDFITFNSSCTINKSFVHCSLDIMGRGHHAIKHRILREVKSEGKRNLSIVK